jgi:hypothetical protein
MPKSYRQTPEYSRFLQKCGWQVEIFKREDEPIYAFVKSIGPIGVLKLQRVETARLSKQWLFDLQTKYRVAATYIEPAGYSKKPPLPAPELLKLGFAVAPDLMIPTKTRLLKISRPEPVLVAGFKPKTRYNLKLSLKQGLEARIYPGQTIARDKALFERYYRLLAVNAKRVGMMLMPKNWFMAQLSAFANQGFVVWVEEVTNPVEPVAVATYFTSRDTVFYSHNGSTAQGRRLMAPTLAVYAGIREAKRRRLDYFDFDGIFDERRPKQAWLGYSRFKAGFGGEERYFELMYKQFRWPFKRAGGS